MVDETGNPPQPPRLSIVPAEASPSGLAGANAPDVGAGGEGAAKPEKKADKKPEKTVDWGAYNGLIENFALIYGTDTVWDGTERIIMKLANMAHAHGADMVKLWKGSPDRRTVRQEDVVFDPTGKADPATKINLFDGIKMEPVEGDVGPVMDLIQFLTSRACQDRTDTDQVFHWLMQWMAYPLQHLGAKLRTAVVMHGDEGAGKNFLFDMLAAIYGKYGALVGQDELEDKFNDWRSCKMLVVGDEVSSRQELVHNKNRLKALITSATVQINPKNLPRREEANHMNVIFLSNEITPLALDNSDRRYLVIYTPRAKDFSYYKALGEWRDAGGLQAFYHYLLTYPLEGFDPYAPAPVTDAKRDLIDINRKSPELFWLAWSTGEIDLPYEPCSVSQGYRAYVKWCQRTGDRFPFKQAMFTRTLLRMSEYMDKPIREKVMAPKDELGVKKSERMLLTLEPPGDGQGKWAFECRDAFEAALRKYMGVGFPHSPNDGSTGGDE
jgi:putative DNA primase/helicase